MQSELPVLAILPDLARAYDLLPQGESYPQDFHQPISHPDFGIEPHYR